MIRAVFALLLLVGSFVPASAGDGGVAVEARLPTASYGLAAGLDSLWSMQGETLLRIDPTDNSITKISLPDTKGGIRNLVIGEGAVWVPDATNDGSGGAIMKVDPATSQVVLTIACDLVVGDARIAVGEGSVWVMRVGGGKAWLARYSTDTGEEQARIPLRPSGFSVLHDETGVWVSGTYKNEVYRIDPATNAVVATIKVPGSPTQLAAGEGSIWVDAPRNGGMIHRIDPATNAIIATIVTDPGIDNFGTITVGGGYVWAIYRDALLLQIDPETNAIVGRYEGQDVAGYNVVYASGSLWLAGYGSQILRITPPAP
jgi:YVTN family beta-propeller protein